MTNRDEIIQKLTRSVFRFVSSKFGMTKEDSEDVVQETMLILFGERYKHLEAEADLVPLAITTARLKALESINRRRNRNALPDDVVSPGAGPESDLLDKEATRKAQEWLEWIRDTVPKMKERCRLLLELRLKGLSTAEIAQELGKTENNIRVMDHRCREEMRQMLPEGAQR